MNGFRLLTGDAIEELKNIPDNSIDCCITSPPYYGLRDYGVKGQIGLENSASEYINRLTKVFSEVRRVLKTDGVLWLNIGDSYVKKKIDGKNKELMDTPWKLAFALQQDGWYLRQDIIWNKPNPMPESVKDRCTKSHEYIFMLTKSDKYYFNADAIREDAVSFQDMKRRVRNGHGEWKTNKGADTYAVSGTGRSREELYSKDGKRNKRDVWTVTTNTYKGAHFATFPEKLIEPCVLAGCREKGIILDPFLGSGTTALVALKNNRWCIGIELNPNYSNIAQQRMFEFEKLHNHENFPKNDN